MGDKSIYSSTVVESIDKSIERLMKEREALTKKLEEIDLEIASYVNFKTLLNTRIFNKEDNCCEKLVKVDD